ncbi:hypothetical protein [Streptosporangium canum]|uniref:hypothetical protein n=1 Tax=Streptosporangium canum TaxID=324952 RepID=UPI00379D1D05
MSDARPGTGDEPAAPADKVTDAAASHRQGAAKGPVSIGLQARSRLRAVALDTNALGRGRPHLGKLITLAARLQGIGLPV